MANVKLTELEKTTDFENSLLYGVDKNGSSKAFDTNALYAKLNEKKDDIFEEAENLTFLHNDIFEDDRKPSKISASLGRFILSYSGIYEHYLSGFDINNTGYFHLNFYNILKENDEFTLYLDFGSSYKSKLINDVIFAYKDNLFKKFNDVRQYPEKVDESFDTRGYDTMFLLKSDYNKSKRLTEKLNLDYNTESNYKASDNFFNYYKGRKLYSEAGFVCGTIENKRLFKSNDDGSYSQIISNPITREACFGLFPFCFLHCAFLTINNISGPRNVRLELLFRKTNDFDVNFIEQNQSTFKNFIIPNVQIDFFLNYLKEL